MTHLVHGMGIALEAPTWPMLADDEVRAILPQFRGVGQVGAVQWHSPRPFSSAVLVQTTGGTFFLKRHHQNVRTPAALVEEHLFMAHLGAAGIAVPEVMATSVGKTVVACGEWTYELHRKAEGLDLYRDRQSWTPFLTESHAFAAGVALAQFHHASRGFAAKARGNSPLISSFTIVPSVDPLAAAEAYIAARPAVAAFLTDKPWRQELARIFAVHGEGLAKRLDGQKSIWTHNDWHPSNLLWTEAGTVACVIDFGLATQTCALYDIATAIERSTIPWLDMQEGRTDTPCDLAAAFALLAGYQSVASLAPSEIETIIRLLPLVHIEFALSEIDYFAGVLSDSDQAQMAWQNYLIDHADWFQSASGQAFLRALEKGQPF